MAGPGLLWADVEVAGPGLPWTEVEVFALDPETGLWVRLDTYREP